MQLRKTYSNFVLKLSVDKISREKLGWEFGFFRTQAPAKQARINWLHQNPGLPPLTMQVEQPPDAVCKKDQPGCFVCPQLALTV
jgi:hypothetical protein